MTLSRRISSDVVWLRSANSVKLVATSSSSSSSASNETINKQSDVDVVNDDDDDDDDELAHAERYRRLIPYMTYYMLNNYINGQQQQSAIDGNPVRPRQPSQVALKQQQQQHQFTTAVHSQPVQIVANKGSGGGGRYKEIGGGGFVPSVQYDPREVRPQQSDFFLPLRYSGHSSKQQQPTPQIYNGYEATVEVAPTPRPLLPVSADPVEFRYSQQQQHQQAVTPTTAGVGVFHPTTFLTVAQKPQHVSAAAPTKLLHEDYGTVENFESVRYVSSSPAPPPPPPAAVAAVETVKARLPPLPQAPPLLQRYPAVPVFRPQQQLQLQLQQQQQQQQQQQPPALVRLDINQVLKGLRLTSRLPEVLTKDNVDGNIKTLVEILRILDAGKRDRYQPAHAVHDKYRAQAAHAKPSQVITESNYQATRFSAVTPHNELLMESPPHRHQHHHYYSGAAANRYISQQHKVPILLASSREQRPSSSSALAPAALVRPYFAEIKSPMVVVAAAAAPQQQQHSEQQVVEIKPATNRYVQAARVNAVLLPAREKAEQVVEIKPVNRYLLAQIKNQTTPTPVPTTEPSSGGSSSSSSSTTESSGSKDIVEYYVPVVQDIDEGVTYTADKEPVISPVQTEAARNNYELPTEANDEILEDEKYTIPIGAEKPQYNLPIQVQNIPPLLKYGATRGKPHVDYPAYTEIPETDFSCKKQRYKGFFGDPDTGCQVWHYCDLNGGKSSFLCPNGTIFSQVALTCDWWFNVKCESTMQLYVLNERLYKYILPIMPKFPEDFVGPEVDKYLELKFKEMEDKMKEKKQKAQEEDKDKNFVNTLQSIEDSKK